MHTCLDTNVTKKTCSFPSTDTGAEQALKQDFLRKSCFLAFPPAFCSVRKRVWNIAGNGPWSYNYRVFWDFGGFAGAIFIGFFLRFWPFFIGFFLRFSRDFWDFLPSWEDLGFVFIGFFGIFAPILAILGGFWPFYRVFLEIFAPIPYSLPYFGDLGKILAGWVPSSDSFL